MKAKPIKVYIPGTTANCGPGFDAVGIACSIYNELELTLTDNDDVVIEVTGEGADVIPTDVSNIVWQSMQAVFAMAGCKQQGAVIHMVNNIPLARGLGSSAAAIVGGVAAANAAIGSPLNQQQLFELATKIEGHPDNVAPAIFGGITLSITDSGQASCLRFLPPERLSLVVAVPAFDLSTKAARQVLPSTIAYQDAVFNVSRTALLVGALSQGKFEYLQAALQDKLHHPYRAPLIPGMQQVLAAAIAQGAYGAVISGAGPCLIAFTSHNDEAIGQAMTAAFAANGIAAVYKILDIDTQGVRIVV